MRTTYNIWCFLIDEAAFKKEKVTNKKTFPWKKIENSCRWISCGNYVAYFINRTKYSQCCGWYLFLSIFTSLFCSLSTSDGSDLGLFSVLSTEGNKGAVSLLVSIKSDTIMTSSIHCIGCIRFSWWNKQHSFRGWSICNCSESFSMGKSFCWWLSLSRKLLDLLKNTKNYTLCVCANANYVSYSLGHLKFMYTDVNSLPWRRSLSEI